MKRIKQDYLDLLEETVKFYSKDPSRRAKTHKGCMYITKDGRSCAVGRCMTEEALEELIGLSSTVYGIDIRFTSIDNTLKGKYRGYNINFWGTLQTLHDSNKYWDYESLSLKGKARVEEIKNDINNNKYNKYED